MQLSVKLGLVPVQPSALSSQLFCAFQKYWIRANPHVYRLQVFGALKHTIAKWFKTMFYKFLRLWCFRVY